MPADIIWEHLKIRGMPKRLRRWRSYLIFVVIFYIVIGGSYSLAYYTTVVSTMYPNLNCDVFMKYHNHERVRNLAGETYYLALEEYKNLTKK